MGTPGSPARVTLADTLRVFDGSAGVGEPLTATEVAEELDCSRRTAYDKLDALAERGDLRSKKTGARGRIWWRPVDDQGFQASDETAVDQAQFKELVRVVDEYAIFVLDAEGTVRSWNDGAERIKGYEEDEIVGRHFSTFYAEEDVAAGVPEENLAIAADAGHVEDEGWRIRKDGGRFWANVTITALRDDDGELEGFLKVTRDMSERHEYEETLRREKERFESLVQEVEDYAIFMLDPDGTVRSWNRGIERIKGYAEEEIVGEHFSVFYPEEARESGVPEQNLAAAAEEGRIEDEGWRVRKDGTEFWGDVVITALRDDDGELGGFAKVTRDMTDRREYEQQLLRQRDELDELNRINATIRNVDRTLVSAATREEIEESVCDQLAASGSYTAAWIAEYGPGYGTITPGAWSGVDDGFLDSIVDADETGPVERELGATSLRTRTVRTAELDRDVPASGRGGEPARGFESVAAIPLVYNDIEFGALVVYADEASGFDERKTTVLGEFGETTAHAIAAVRRKERERTLTALHESTRELPHAETAGEIGEVVVAAATEHLGLRGAVVYGFDTADNVLAPLTASTAFESPDDALPSFAPGDDAAVWTSFVDGETVLAETAADAGFPAGRDPDLQHGMVVPLGDHGVLAVGSTERGRLDSDTRKLVELLGATTQAAFTRVENEANLRERDTVLQEQNRRLQRLNQLNDIIREVDQQLVGATTREEIHREVCELLTTSDRFRLAWIGTLDAAGDRLNPLSWHGTGRDYLDSVSFDGEERAAEPAVRTAHTGDISVVSNVADDLRAGTWRKEAFSREFQSVISVPLEYGERDYGVLTVYADRPGLFGEMEQAIFAELGYTIGNAINTVEMKEDLFADRMVELEFRLSTDADSFLPQLARQLGCRVEFEGVVPTTDHGARIFFTARDVSPDDVVDAMESAVAVESTRMIASRDDGSLFEAVVSGHVIATTLVEHNASLRTLVATNDEGHVTIELPATADVREFVEVFQTEYSGIQFVARRERDRPIETREDFRARLESALTDRQLEVLEMAYLSGFFDTPRGSTGGDIADALDVSQPTITGHLRAAQRKLLDHVLDER